MGYRLNRLTKPVFIAVSKLLLTEFGIHYRLESCDVFYKTSYCFAMFSGCISQLKISGNNERISPGLVANKVGVTGCETCAVNPCQNGGVCQGKLVNQGFRLSIVLTDESKLRCDFRGEL